MVASIGFIRKKYTNRLKQFSVAVIFSSGRFAGRSSQMATTEAVPSFEEDIKPLFRPRDVNAMQAVAGFNLHKYEDVRVNAGGILERLRLNMPCDGLWPEEDVKKFEAWKNGGMPA